MTVVRRLDRLQAHGGVDGHLLRGADPDLLLVGLEARELHPDGVLAGREVREVVVAVHGRDRRPDALEVGGLRRDRDAGQPLPFVDDPPGNASGGNPLGVNNACPEDQR